MGTLTDTLSTGPLSEKPPTHSPSGSAGQTTQVLVPQERFRAALATPVLLSHCVQTGSDSEVSTSLANPGSPAKQE